jgi:hypothetical protein
MNIEHIVARASFFLFDACFEELLIRFTLLTNDVKNQDIDLGE